ncbi:hypothetical protein GCM10012275_37890 [Longimycelium tulufanense]|uniref:Uncharacterized protein n=1 Tax=Longimycelium tulufanense TaxID=907463 RepID=A0A8J3CHU7_9PSEU|nr:hypothetical protein [Longimycelium tulufanense]GGM63748.1 hypothetical protein GCM10012275_37890 [Longimycelium tulufanense]
MRIATAPTQTIDLTRPRFLRSETGGGERTATSGSGTVVDLAQRARDRSDRGVRIHAGVRIPRDARGRSGVRIHGVDDSGVHSDYARGVRIHAGVRIHQGAERGVRIHADAGRGVRIHGDIECGVHIHGGVRIHRGCERGVRIHGGVRSHGEVSRGVRIHGQRAA